MKKILKWGAIIIVVLIVLGAITGDGSKDKNQSIKEAFNEGADKGKEVAEQIMDDEVTETENNPNIQEESPTANQDQKGVIEANNKSDESLDLSIEKLNLLEDVTQVETMFSDLKEQYKLVKQKGDYEFDSVWITNWNKQRRKLAEKYTNHVFNKNDKYSPAKSGLSTALADLHTLWREYENSLQGKEHDISDFEQFVEDGLSTAKENLEEE